MSEVRIRFDLLPKQREFLTCPAREVGYSGAFRAGKSLAGCIRTVMRACKVPGAREAIIRKELVHLKATTLKTLLQGDGLTPPILPQGSYRHLITEKTIKLKNGSEIVYLGLDDPEKIGSYSLSGAFIDEASQLTEHNYHTVRGRLSLKLPGLNNALCWAANPSNPTHHLALRFGLAGSGKAADGCVAIRATMFDNERNLDPGYVLDAKTWTGIRYKRFVLGQWVASDGLVYDKWNREIHARSQEAPGPRVILGVDAGYTNPFACVCLRVDGDGRAHVCREVYQRGLQIAEQVQAVRSLASVSGAEPCEAVLVDPSAATLIADLRAAGLPVVQADNSVIDGIYRVQQRLEDAGDGRPRLTVDPGCGNLISEFETYEWIQRRGTDALKDQPVKEHDHALDALRYAVMYLDKSTRPILQWTGIQSPAPEKTIEDLRMDPLWGFED